MPQTVQIGFIVLGGFLVLIGILGGKFKLFGGEVADKVSNGFLRLVAFILGAILIIFAAMSSTNSNIVGPDGKTNNGIKYQTQWTCYNNGKPVDNVTIWWGHNEGAAEWACNNWLSTCGNKGGCTAIKISR